MTGTKETTSQGSAGSDDPLEAPTPPVPLTGEVRRAMEVLAGAPADAAKHPGKSGEQKHQGTKHAEGTTSDLSIDETLLLHFAGWEPVDLVFGISWWSVPWGVWQWQTGEVAEASSAFAGAFDQATHALSDECERVGATGVVGVRLEHRVSSHHVAVTLSGTAVRRVGDHHPHFEFVSGLSARDFVLLSAAGWWPIGLAAGASFVIAPRRSVSQWAAQQNQNIELPNLTQSLYLARERAMDRMQSVGHTLGSAGIVGVSMREGRSWAATRVMQFVAVGTAVRLRDTTHRPLSPQMVVPLDERVRQFEATSLRRPGPG